MLNIMQRDTEGRADLATVSTFPSDILSGHSDLPTMVCRADPFPAHKFRRSSVNSKDERGGAKNADLEYLDNCCATSQGDPNAMFEIPKRKMRRLIRKDLTNDSERSPVSGWCVVILL